MEAQHMSQQVFANYIGTTPATLSGIFNDRTRPTINIIESIKKKFPDISLDWLMFGLGEMYQSPSQKLGVESDPEALTSTQTTSNFGAQQTDQVINFAQMPAPTPQFVQPTVNHFNSVRNTRVEQNAEMLNNDKKPLRRVTEIRVYYDDQTWESFVPSKK